MQRILISILVISAFQHFSLSAFLFAQPQQMNYQGFLTDVDGSPLDTVVSMTFKMYDAATSGTQLWTETQPSCTVRTGLLNVQLGSVTAIPDSFNRAQVWLGVTVGSNSEMIPRMRFVSVPYAYRVSTVDGAAGGTVAGDVNISGKGKIGSGNTNSGLMAFVAGDNNSASGNYSCVTGGRANTAAESLATIGGGDHNVAASPWTVVSGGAWNAASGQYATVSGGGGSMASGAASTVGGGWNNRTENSDATVSGGSVNVASGIGAFIGGGAGNRARGNYSVVAGGGGASATDSNVARGLNSTIGGGRNNFARGDYSVIAGGGGQFPVDSNSASGDYASIGGGRDHLASGDYATIGGGRFGTASNYYATVGGGSWSTASGNSATVSGGSGNTASGIAAAIGGGFGNTASSDWGSIGGGYGNTVSTYEYSTVAGGHFNKARGQGSTIGGGGGLTEADSNSIRGNYSTIPGGASNRIIGNYAFAAGYRARTEYNSAFVWGSSSSTTDSTAAFANYSFTVRCPGGARFYTDHTGAATGVSLSAGGGSWNNLCDVRQKRLHGAVNTSEILSKISQLPLHQWSYKTQNDNIRHIGPTAQDFFAAFKLGESDTTINTLDPDGIALAAIQELAKQNEALRKRVEQLESELHHGASANQTSVIRER
jgi:trimeric autotransporter adhesin